ncbi:MAG TPA: PIN domain-containing protein [Solirubrobacter sp.]|nr:PIN domain-containing protein [Solirubrobacter sp.]
MTEPFGSIPLVIDSSAWFRQHEPTVRARWQATARAGLLAACPVVALEVLANTRAEDEYHELSAVFDELPQAPVTASVCRAALAASRELRGSRRLPAADYLIAAAAAERGFGVLHKDRHFDTLARVLPFQSVWLE